MLKNKLKVRGAALLVVFTLLFSVTAAQADTAKNVIFMISDGWGYNQIQATNFYNGVTLESYEKFPVKLGMSTYSASNPAGYNPNQAWATFDYVKNGATDSASAATAMATGIKNYDGQINWYTSQAPMIGKTITEKAQKVGKASGVVTTVEWSHATPAAMYAHNTSRGNYSEIANEMLGSSSPLNVIMGAGNPEFDDNGIAAAKTTKYVGGQTTWDALKNGSLNDWNLIQEKSQFENLANGSLVLNKVVGTFQAHTTAQQGRSDAVKGPDANNPSGVAFNNNVPDLATMSEGALNVLKQDLDGYFLMIEGGAVDWANHANQLGRLIEEQTDFNKAVDRVMAWVEKNSNWHETLLIVTGDHETGFLWGPTQGEFSTVVNNGQDFLPGAKYNSGDHTNSLIPLFAKGANADLFFDYVADLDGYRGAYIDNTAVFAVMNTVVTPIPGSAVLMITGVIGMLVIGRRRQRS